MTITIDGSSTTAPTGSELLERFRPEMSAIPISAVLTPRVDAATAANVAIGSMRGIEVYRSALVARWGDRATTALDRIVPTAHALLAAEAADHASAEPDLETSAADLRAQRDRLAVAATTLIDRGLVSKRTLAKLNGGSSYQALVVDTVALVQWFRMHASAIAPLSKVTPEELQRAEQSALAFTTQMADRNYGQANASVTADDRARIFTLFFRNYELVARMLGYLRWREGDADQIAQTIYQRKRARRDDTTAAPQSPPASNAPVSPGMPGGNPFHT
jgi:hypothetical protein